MWPTAWKFAKLAIPNMLDVVAKSSRENPKTALLTGGAGAGWLSADVANKVGEVLRRLAEFVESLPGVL